MTTNSPTRRRPRIPAISTTAPWLLVALLSILAVVKLSYGFERLLVWPTGGAIDLKLRYDETRAWFAGYWIMGAVYPPASQTILWPVVGWLPFEDVRGLWGILTLVCLAWLSVLCARECGLRSTAGRAACALLPLAMNSTSSAVAIGQIAPLFLPIATTAVLWMARGPSRWSDAAGAAVLFTIASVKPTLFAPFAGLVLLLPRSLRPAILSAGFYVALTVLALLALRPVGRSNSVVARLGAGLQTKTAWATSVTPLDGDRTTLFGGGYGNLQNMSQNAGLVGLENFVLPVASALACWAWLVRRRRTDPWILLGVCGLAARLGWYHRVYDDMLLVLPLIALVRIAATTRGRGADDRTAAIAATLVGATALQLLAPMAAGPLLRNVLGTLAFWIWLIDLAFLVRVAPAFEPGGETARPTRGEAAPDASGFVPFRALGAA